MGLICNVKRGLCLSALMAAGLAPVGCDDESAQSARSRAALNEAIVLLSEAESGYNPQANDQSYPAFRMEQLGAVEAKLQEVANQGDDFTKTEAQRLLAGVELAKARAAVQQAQQAYAQLTSGSVSLFNHVQAVERINALMTARSSDGGAVVSALQEGESMISEKKAGVTSNLADLNQQREAAMVQAEQFNAQASGHFNRAQELEKSAFVESEDKAKQEAYADAYSAQIEGQAAQRQAREAQIEVDRLSKQIDSLQTESSLWDQMTQQISQLQERVRNEGQAAARDVTQAESNQKLELATVREKFDGLNSLYEQDVDQALSRAAEQAQSAVSRLERVSSSSRGGDRSGAQFEQLAAQVELARALSLHSGYAKNYAVAVQAVADNPTVTGSAMAQSLQSLHSGLTDQAKSLSERAASVIADARTLADALSGDSPMGQASASLAESLQAYEARLN